MYRGKCMSNSIFRAAKLSSSHWLHHYHDLLSCRHPSAGLNKPLQKPAYFCLPEPSHSGKPGEKWLNSCLGSLDTPFLHTAETKDGVSKRGRAGWAGGRSRGKEQHQLHQGQRSTLYSITPSCCSPIPVLLHANATLCTGSFLKKSRNLAGLQAAPLSAGSSSA